MLDHDFRLKPSTYGTALVLGLLVLLTFILMMLPIHAGWRFLCLLFLSGYGYYLIKLFRLSHTSAVKRLRRLANGNWLIHTPTHLLTASLLEDSVVTPAVSFLRLKVPGRRLAYVAIIFPDSLSANDYRRLRILLKMYA